MEVENNNSSNSSSSSSSSSSSMLTRVCFVFLNFILATQLHTFGAIGTSGSGPELAGVTPFSLWKEVVGDTINCYGYHFDQW